MWKATKWTARDDLRLFQTRWAGQRVMLDPFLHPQQPSPANHTAPAPPSQSRPQNPSLHELPGAPPANLSRKGRQNLFEPQVYSSASARAPNQISGHVTGPALSDRFTFHPRDSGIGQLCLLLFCKKERRKDWITVEVLSDKVKDAFKYHWLLCKVILKISCSSGLQ